MKKLNSILIVFLVLFTACKKDNAFFEGEIPTEGKALLEKAIETEVTVGIAAGYSINGKVEWQEGAGESDSDNNITFTPNTLTRIASIAKPMTAVAIMQLYERGQLDLDASIQTYLPTFPIKTEGEITVRQLLNHAAGLDAYQSDAERENTKNYASLADALTIFQDRALIATPGMESVSYTHLTLPTTPYV